MNYLNGKMGFYLQFITLFLCFTLAFAVGKISPEMEKILSKIPPGSEITVLVKPAFEVEIYALNSELERAKITRAERHCRLIKELKRKSAAAQAGLLAELEKTRAAGLVKEYKPFWIVNLVVVKATAQAIRKLAVIKEVSEILENKKVRPRTAEKKRVTAWSSPRFASTSNEFNWGLRSINAHRLWERGITGRGVLVAVIDFGIDGSHPGLKDKWRGANGASAEESFKGWFDSNGFPIDITPHGPDEPEQSHGTGTLGQLVGQDGADTVGVAPDAQWIAVSISANTLGDTSEVMHFLMLLEWLADPDSDPETVNDMPDILSISLYMVEGCPCNSPYDEAFSNLKALGVTPIFAAGNVGSEGSFTVIAPGTRPEFFAVGAVDRYDVVADFSSRGPSSCDKNIIKPDVVAPGVKTLSLRPLCYGEGYQEFGGTSGAAPLTAGVAALLKQYDPELTPDEIYNVLRKSAKDLGKPGPDNDYGWGLVNAEAALSMVEPPISPNFTFTGTEVNAGEDDLIYPGEKASVVLRLANIGAEAKAVTATLSSLNPDVTVTSAHASFGDLGTFEKAYNSEEPFIVEFSPQLPYSVKRTFFSLSVTSGDFSCTLPLALNVMHEEPVEPPKKGIAVHNAGKAALSLTNYGVIGRDNEQGGGFQYPYVDNTTPDHLYRGSLLIAAGLALVSDATFNESTSGYSLKFDSDFSPIPGGDIQITAPGSFADLEVTGIFSDNEAADPLGVRIYQRSYAWSAEADDDYVIVQYTLRIPYGSESLVGVYVAQHLDWDVGGGEDSGEDDLVGFDSGLRLAYMYDNVSNVYVGHA
ncbi:MAG TPA: S8 family serine peptidase, partial [archaeon]|nr:S8 family serine peptidase [archaeon]